MPGTNLLVLVGLLFYLAASLVLWKLLLREPPRLTRRRGRTARPPRWPIRLAKAVATAVGGAASGAVALLLIVTVVNAGKPGTITAPVKWVVWAVAAVLAILFIGRARLIRRVAIKRMHGVERQPAQRRFTANGQMTVGVIPVQEPQESPFRRRGRQVFQLSQPIQTQLLHALEVRRLQRGPGDDFGEQ